jgi:cytochrome c oxidase assembly protein subunit 11
MDALQKANRKLMRRLLLVSVAMFGFGFAMWPLYTVFCQVTGFGGRGVQVNENMIPLESSERVVSLRFDASVNSGLPWNFEASESVRDIQLGTPAETRYLAMNPTEADITGHAVYNVTPPEASLYFVKTECFCFTEQVLTANETREMPVYFYIQSDLPEHISEITLSYTFYRSDRDTGLAIQDGSQKINQIED